MTFPNKKTLPGELFLLAGLLFCSLANAILIKADYGLTPLSSLPYVISLAFPLFSFGTWSAFIQCFWLVFTMAVIHKFKPGYLLSFVLAFLYGLMIDGWSSLIFQWSVVLGARLAYLFCGLLIMSLGVSSFVVCGLPVLPFDTVVRAFTTEKNMSVRRARTGFEVINLLMALTVVLIFLKSLEGVGLATLLSAMLMGTLAGFISGRMKSLWKIEPLNAWLERLV